MQKKEDFSTQSQKEAKLGLAMPFLQEVPVTSIWTIPIEVDDVILNIGKKIPLLILLLIPNYVHYHSILKLMNVFWASIFVP
jgi:hypothetical protein